ncbi:uncharacterized protein LOC105168444 [Sesamum indicum]|uniref:Uncharacterized protein LOC105168444 n=1 Tax=Sesamum indicum TaxID=4182 RepID=A0A6I9TZ80_SESIN|nr:uncharacterized protein LOC105168444 [Sesamum indicum]
MKMRNKVHPFISSSSSSSSPTKDPFPVLNLLPAAILTLISVLSLEDRQVLAYMITRSLKSSNPSKKPSKKQSLIDSHGRQSPALFDCDCFHCYTSFWFRWDSSPNRELIHQAIEAFEEHLTNSEQFNKVSAPGNAKNRKKDKTGRRKNERGVTADGTGSRVLEFPPQQKNQESLDDLVPPPETELGTEDVLAAEDGGRGAEPEDALATAAPAVVVRNHKGLARKVLPDVMGIFSSRLWSLWSPNV